MLRTIGTVYREAYGGLPQEIWITSAAMFINRTGSMVIAFLTLYLTLKLGWTISTAGSIFSVYGLGSIAGVFLGGKLVRRIGAIRTQIFGLIAAGPCYMMVPMFNTWQGVAMAVFLMSFFSEMVRPANNVAIAQFASPEKRVQAYGLQRMALNLGFSIGPAVGGLLTLIDYYWLFIVDGCFSMAGGLFLIYHFGFNRYSRHQYQAEKQRRAESANSMGSPLKDFGYLVFLGLYLLAMLVFYQFTVCYPKFMTEHFQLNEPKIGMLYAINTLLIVTLEMVVLNFVKSFNLLKMIGWGALLACFGFGILPFQTALWFAILAMVILTFGEMLLMPLATTYVAERSTGRDQSMYMSFYAMTYSLAAILAPLLGSAIYEIDRNRIWYFSLAIGVTVFVAMGCLSRRSYQSVTAVDLTRQE